jgi:NTP pyrophosphatase (non-canonical NTP hydrolase)
MELNEYQRSANRTDQRPLRPDDGEMEREMALVFPLTGLSSEVGSLLNQYKKHVRDGDSYPLFSQRVKEELGDILWYVANLAAKLDFELDDIADLNLSRIAERWPEPGTETPPRLLDDGYPPAEQLPRQLTISFEEREVDGRPKMVMVCEGKPLGNPLVDMNRDPDGYRFHDVFHLTYAALLGWSPLLRALLERKRDSDPDFREVEDSARAIFIEEGLAAYLFSVAKDNNFFDGIQQVDSEVLRVVKNIVSHLEARSRTTAQWQRTILRSYEMWRPLKDNNGGTVHLDLVERTIDYESPSAA